MGFEKGVLPIANGIINPVGLGGGSPTPLFPPWTSTTQPDAEASPMGGPYWH